MNTRNSKNEMSRIIILIFACFILLAIKSDINMEEFINNRFSQTRAFIKNSLSKTYNAIILKDSTTAFSLQQQKNLLSHTVIIDTVIRGFKSEKNSNKILAEIASDSLNKIYVVLTCSNKISDKLELLNYTSYFLAASISRIDKSSIAIESNLFGEGILTAVCEELLLTGECIDLKAVPYIYSN